MKTENKCESPLGGWFNMCDLYNKDGTYRGMGTGKAVANVTYYNVDDDEENEYTYQMCQNCVDYEKLNTHEHQITEIKYFDDRQSEYPNTKVILL